MAVLASATIEEQLKNGLGSSPHSDVQAKYRSKLDDYKLIQPSDNMPNTGFAIGSITCSNREANGKIFINVLNIKITKPANPSLAGSVANNPNMIGSITEYYDELGLIAMPGGVREIGLRREFFGYSDSSNYYTEQKKDGELKRIPIDQALGIRPDTEIISIAGRPYCWYFNTEYNEHRLMTGGNEAVFVYFPYVSEDKDSLLIDADVLSEILAKRLNTPSTNKNALPSNMIQYYGKMCAIAMNCPPIAWASTTRTDYSAGMVLSEIENGNFTTKLNIPNTSESIRKKRITDPAANELYKQEKSEKGTLGIKYRPLIYEATNLQQGYPSTCQTWIDMSAKPPVAHIPDAMPERPDISPFPIGSDIASIVLEDGKFMRFGDVRMPLCVESISVKERPSIDVVGLLRNKGNMKRNAGHTSVQVDVSVLFRGTEEINGFTIDANGLILEDPVTKERPILSGILLEHFGLRPLIATFRRAPFIPVINSTLNIKFGIDALAFVSMQLLTEDGAPGIIRANLSFVKFDYNIYLSELQNFSDAFNWPLYQKYVYNGLCVPTDKAIITRGSIEKGQGHLYLLNKAIELDEYNSTPPEQNAHLPRNLINGIAATSETHLFSDELIDAACGQYKLEPMGYTLEKDPKHPKAKLKPIPTLKYDHTTKTFARNNALQGGVTFHIADEDRLRSIRNYGIQQRQAYQKQLEALKDHTDKLSKLDSEISSINYKKQELEKEINATEISINKNTMAVDMIVDSLTKITTPVDEIFKGKKKEVLRDYKKEKQVKIKAIEKQIEELDQKEKQLQIKRNQLLDSTSKAKTEVEQIEKILSREAEQSLVFKPFQLPADAILEGVEVLMVNNFSQQPLESKDNPAMQYIGAADTVIRLGFQCKDETVTALHELRQHLQYLSREYRWIAAKLEDRTVSDLSNSGENAFIKSVNDKYAGQQLETAFMMLDQEIANLCGVESVLITDIDFQKIPEAPDWYNVSVSLIDFDRTQKKHEALNKIKSSGEINSSGFSLTYESIFGKRDINADIKNVSSAMSNDQLKKMLYEIETYPDLELPTMATVNAWLHELRIDAHKSNFAGVHIGNNFTAPDGDPRLLEYCHVDPDFYITTEIMTAGGVLLDNLYQHSAQQVAVSDDSGSGRMDYIVPNKNGTDRFSANHIESGNMGNAVLRIEKDGTLINNLKSATINVKSEHDSAGRDKILRARQLGANTVESNNTKIDPRKHCLSGTMPYNDGVVQLPDPLRQVKGKNIYASTPEARAKEVCKPAGMMGGVEFMEASLFSNFSDWYQHGKGGRLIKAFPSYWVTVVDSGRLQGQLVLNDFFYGLNGLSAITVVKNREQPADLCMLRMSNVYGNFTNVTAQRALDEGVRRKGWSEIAYYVRNAFTRFPSGSDIARREQDVVGLAMQPGARLHVRIGYGSCPHALPVVFNGTITEVPAGEGEIEIIAMGDGLELLNDTQGEPNQTLGGFFHGSEPQDMLASIMGARGGLPPSLGGGGMKRIGNWFQRMIFNVFPGFDSDNPLGISHFGNPFFRIGDESFGECMQNIYRSNDRGARPGHCFKYDRNDDEPFDTESGNAHIRTALPSAEPSGKYLADYWPADFSQWLAFTETMSFGQKEFSTELYGKTLWDLAVLSTQVAPDYLCSVVPFQFRSSLFYGKAYYPYCYDYKLSQMRVPEIVNGVTTWVVYGTLPRHWTSSDGNSVKIDKAVWNGVTTQAIKDDVRYCRPTTDATLKANYISEGIVGTEQAAEVLLSKKFTSAQLRKPFQQVYPINSSDDIISNNITASSEGVYTVVRGKYKCKHFKITLPIVGDIGDPFKGPDDGTGRGVSADMTLPVYADYTMFPENKRAITVDTQIYIGRLDQFLSVVTNRDPHGNLPNNVATTILKNYMSYMYKGNVTILGIPSIKPHDCIVVDDTYNELHGPVGVREVVHQLNGGSGLTSTIEPDALVSIADQRLLRNWSMFRNIGGMVAYQRLITAEAGDTRGERAQTNIAEKLKLMLALVDTYVSSNITLLKRPDVKRLCDAIQVQRDYYEYMIDSMENGYAVDPEYYNIKNNVDPAIISYNEKQYESEYYGAYDYLNTYDHKRQTAELRRENIIINHGKAPRLPKRVVGPGANDDDRKSLSSLEKSTTLKIISEAETPYYRIPYDIGGPASSDIIMFGELLTGNLNNIEKPNLITLLTQLFDLVNMDNLIIDHAMDNLLLNEPTAHAWITTKQQDFAIAEKKRLADSIVVIKTWFEKDVLDRAKSKLNAQIKKHKLYSDILNHDLLADTLLDILGLARLLLDSRVIGSGVKTKEPRSDEDINSALTELNKSYSLILFSCSKDFGADKDESKYTSIVTDYLFKEKSHMFSDSAIRLKESTIKDSLYSPASHVGRYYLSRLLLHGVLRSGGLYKILYNTAHFSEWMTGQVDGAGKWFGYGKVDPKTGATLPGKEKTLSEIIKTKSREEIKKFRTMLRTEAKAGNKTANFIRGQISKYLRYRATVRLPGASIFEKLKGLPKATNLNGMLNNIRTASVAAKASAAGGKAGNILMRVLGLAELSNPVGWIMLAVQAAAVLITGTVLNKLNCLMANLHACEMVLLRKHGAEFSAGINGHQGLVYGDNVNAMSKIFNQLSGKEENETDKDGKSNNILSEWKQTTIGVISGVIGVRFPYTPEMSYKEQEEHKIVDDLFNSRSFVDQSAAIIKARGLLGDLGELLNAIELGNTLAYYSDFSQVKDESAANPNTADKSKDADKKAISKKKVLIRVPYNMISIQNANSFKINGKLNSTGTAYISDKTVTPVTVTLCATALPEQYKSHKIKIPAEATFTSLIKDKTLVLEVHTSTNTSISAIITTSVNNNKSINEMMVDRGLVKHSNIQNNEPFNNLIKKAQIKAKNSKLGIWKR